MKTLLQLLGLQLLLLLGACGAIFPETDDGAPLAAELARLLEDFSAPTPPVRPPAAAAQPDWVLEPYSGHYEDNATGAIRALLDGRPVRFEFFTDPVDPVVNPPPGAESIADHLDAISLLADWDWSIEQGVLVVTDRVSRSYFIESPPGIRLARVSFDALSGESENRLNSLQLTGNPYDELDRALQALSRDFQPPEGAEATHVLTPSINSLTLTGPPSLHRRAAALIADFNRGVSAKVHLIITVYEVAFTGSSQRSIDFDLMREAAISATAQFRGSRLVQTTPGGLSLGLDFFEGNSVDASRLIFNLLRQQGATRVKLHESFEAQNNLVLTIQDQRNIPYISEVSLQRQDGGSISSLTPSIETEEINTGLGFHVLATVANDVVNVRLSLSQSDLVRFDQYQFGSGESAISGSLPVTDSQHRVIPMSLRDGETRLVANLTQTQFTTDRAESGLGPIGRSVLSDNSERQTVIAVSARIL